MTRSTAHTTLPRLFVAGSLRDETPVELTEAQGHYLGSVLRRADGALVRVFNGLDGEWLARLASAKRRAVLTLEQRLRDQTPEPGPWLLFAQLKRDATDLVVRQAVELGASRILPAITERTNAARVNQDRLRAIAIEAAEQSERLTVPPIEGPARLDSILTAWPPDRRLYAAFERTGETPFTAGPEPAALLVGPEGGFTPRERDWLCRFPFVVPLSLGPFVLRAETAAAAGLALLPRMGSGEYVGPT